MTLPGRTLTPAELGQYNRWLNSLTEAQRAVIRAQNRLAQVARKRARQAAQ